MDYLLAHDVGTGEHKAALVTAHGRVVATAYEPYTTHYPHPLWAEQDPEDWWRAVASTTQRVLQVSGARPGEILGLSFSTSITNVIPLDAQARPLRPCIFWLDGRAGEEARMVMRKLGGSTIFAMIAGTAITGKDFLAKYLWLKRHEPDIYAQAMAIVDMSSYLLYRATGRLVYEWSAASATGVFNLKTKVWDMAAMRLFGCDPSKFPDLIRPSERVGGLKPEAAAELGLLAGTPVFGGAGDVMTAAVGAGAVREGDGYLYLGSSGFFGIITSRQVTGKRGIVTIQSADPNKLLLLAETETVGACLKWAAKELYGAEASASIYQRMDGDVAGAAPGAGGLIFTPWMYGERCPVADESVRAAFINLGTNHTRPQMTRAIYEGVAYNVRWMLESVADLYGFRPDPLRVIGGGAKGLPWLQTIADVTGRTLESAPNPQEAAAVGAAFIAAVGLGIYPSLEAIKSLMPAGHVVKPDPAPRATYDELYAAYRQVYRSLRGLYRTLNRPKEQAEG